MSISCREIDRIYITIDVHDLIGMVKKYGKPNVGINFVFFLETISNCLLIINI